MRKILYSDYFDFKSWERFCIQKMRKSLYSKDVKKLYSEMRKILYSKDEKDFEFKIWERVSI